MDFFLNLFAQNPTDSSRLLGIIDNLQDMNLPTLCVYSAITLTSAPHQRWQAKQITATVGVFAAGEWSESILQVVRQMLFSHIFRVRRMRLVIQLTDSVLSIKVAAMATRVIHALHDTLFYSLGGAGGDGVVF